MRTCRHPGVSDSHPLHGVVSAIRPGPNGFNGRSRLRVHSDLQHRTVIHGARHRPPCHKISMVSALPERPLPAVWLQPSRQRLRRVPRMRHESIAMNKTAHSKTSTFLWCLSLGIGYALLVWLVFLVLVLWYASSQHWAIFGTYVIGLLFSVFYGSLTGVAWSLFAIPILRQRPLKPAFFVLGFVLAPFAVGHAHFLAFKPTDVPSNVVTSILYFGPTSIFIATLLVLWRVLPATSLHCLCRECEHETKENTPGICSNCGDPTLFRQRSRHIGLLAIIGQFLSAGVAALFVLTRSHSCGYWGDATVLGFGQGAFLIHFNPLTYEGWFWSTFSFIPMSGYVWWPVFTQSTVLIPLWIPFVIILSPSILLWRRSRMSPPGFCQECEYNLQGNVSGVCPECGSKVNLRQSMKSASQRPETSRDD